MSAPYAHRKLPRYSIEIPVNDMSYSSLNQIHSVQSIHQTSDIAAKIGSSRKRIAHEPLIQKSSPKAQNCLTALTAFAQETTIHGMWHMIRKDRHWMSRLVWFVAFSVSFGVCSYFITMSILRYVSDEVKTTASIEVQKEIEFPAITFCNENVGKKSLVGSNDMFLTILAAFVARSRDEFAHKLMEVFEICKHNATNDPVVKQMKNGYDFWKNGGLNKGFSLLAPDSNYSVLKCWWKNDEKNCSELFMNHMTDHGWCFTVNPHPTVVKSYNFGLKTTDTAYGLSKDFQLLKLLNTGPNNNLRLMLNVHQEDYCVSQHDTAGFKIIIHNPRIQPLFSQDRLIYLAPGYETHIGVKFRRDVKLEVPGRCTYFQSLKLYPNATIYFKEACYLECLARNIYNSCKCVPAHGPPRANYILAEELNVKYINICFTEMLCMKEYEYKVFETGLRNECKYCVDACNNTEYDFHISHSYFPNKESFGYYSNLTGASSLDVMRENYLTVDVYVENMVVNVITETQAFTFDQLVADMGGQLGFLLGMSVLSLFEFIQFIMPAKREKKLRKIVQPNDYETKFNEENSNHFRHQPQRY